MHQAIRQRRYDAIVVVGVHNRASLSETFQGEKTDKPFNWQRPTVLSNGNELLVQCFPGFDHVEHYAELIATYLELQYLRGIRWLTPPSKVAFIPSSCSDTRKALQATNLKALPPNVETVVLGLVHRLPRLTGVTDWQGDGCFAWVVRRFEDQTIAFVGCRPSFWGDIAGEIVHYLASLGFIRQVLYFGKLGSVKKGVQPNTRLATGGQSYVNGRLIEWQNVLEGAISRVAPDCTITGTHLTLGSVLHETKEWLAGLPSSVDFVDPEIGTMAQASVRSGIGFGYLHLISDNVAEKYPEDLSNERELDVLRGRSHLYEVVQDVFHQHFSPNSNSIDTS